MAALTLAIAASVAAGVLAQRRYGDGAQRLTRRVLDALLYGALPFITFFVLARAEFSTSAGVGLVLAYAVLSTVGLLAYLLATRLLHLDALAAATVVIATIMANTGFLGLPLTATLLGHDELSAAVTYDVLVSGPMFFVVGFAIAAVVTTRGQASTTRLHTYIVRNPPLIAVVAALLAPDALAPDVLVDIAKVGLVALAPVGFFVVGVALATEARAGAFGFPPPLTTPIATIVGLRLVVAPALMLGLSALVIDVPDAYLVQAAMPVGVNTIVVAHAYDLDRSLAAGALAWSTAIALAAGLVADALG